MTNVYACIAAVSAEIAQTGISKSRSNAQQGYKFRGIDDVYNALAPILAKHGLVILPRMLSREQTERVTKNGTALFSVVVDAEFDFVSTKDGSKHTTKAFGEAMDSADKATNKAMSAAYKYTAFQTFCIPTEGNPDADATTPEEVAPSPPPKLTPPEQRAVKNGHGADLLISAAQRKRFWAIAKAKKWTDAQVKQWLSNVYNLESTDAIPRAKYDAIIDAVSLGYLDDNQRPDYEEA